MDMVRPCTKYAALVTSPADIRRELEKAVRIARQGRPGPVWLDLPLDIQSSKVRVADLAPYAPEPAAPGAQLRGSQLGEPCRRLVDWLRQASRPVLLAGHGIKAARGKDLFLRLIDRLQVPVLQTWNALDLIPSDHPLYVGRPGSYGQRGANFAIQNCDLLLSVGSRLSVPQVGYEYAEFARAARKVYVDIDPAELGKFHPPPDLPVCADAREFLEVLLGEAGERYAPPDIRGWRERCQQWREQYPCALPEYAEQKGAVNSFTFIDVLSDELADDELIIPGASGTAFTCTHQTLRVRPGQTAFTSNGFAEMGFDLPGAIGACVARDRKRTVLITGDGSFQMNLQELQTIVHHRLPIKIFYLNNLGYLTIRQTQNGLFKGDYTASGPETGVSFPDIQGLGRVYGFTMFRVSEPADLSRAIRATLDSDGPAICEVVMDARQPLVPKMSFKELPDGRLVSPPLEDLYPFLPRDEFRRNMIVPTIKDDF